MAGFIELIKQAVPDKDNITVEFFLCGLIINEQRSQTIITDLCQKQETINFKGRTVKTIHNATYTNDGHSVKQTKTQNMSTSLKYNNYMLINFLFKCQFNKLFLPI